MKKNVIVIICLIIFSIGFIFILNIFKMQKETYYNTIENNIKTNSKPIFLENGTIEIDYDELENYYDTTNKYVTQKIYKSMVDYGLDIILKDKSVKMYKENNKTILQYKLDRKKAQQILENIVNVKDDMLVKIYFETNKKYADVNVEKIYYKLNHEEVNRANMVKTLQAQVDNTGEKYWRWYGYNHRVEWCAVFVSWVANENGQLKNGNIPKFIWVKKGVDFFKEKNRFKYAKKYKPKPADVIFFDWNNNGVIDHVGYVEKVTKKYVYTIEGNVKYLYVKRKKYKLNSPYIYGYGVPNY